MRSVLKLAPGEMIVVGDGTGTEAQCRIVSYDRKAVILEGLAVGRNPNEPARKTTLYCAVLKAENFEVAAQKAVETGAARIVPVRTARTVKLNLRRDRLERIIREAAEQSERGIVPELADITELDRALGDAVKNDANYFFHPEGAAFTGPAKGARSAGVFIGPEGGWDDRELERAHDLGMRVVSLGGIILRAQTAAAVATYLVANGSKS
jgi:16S rRNA (uracil1498-N3)-methyltransferase